MKREYSHRYTDLIKTVATASNHFGIFRPAFHEVLIYARESYETQRDHLKAQIDNVDWGVGIQGAGVLDVFAEVGRGYDFSRPELLKATEAARRYGVPLVAETTCRFIRSPRHPEDHTALPTEYDFWQFFIETDAEGVLLMTLYDPDLTWKEVRKVQSRRGQIGSGNFGGRPTTKRPGYKKQRRLELKGQVQEMRRAGASVRQTGEHHGIPASTVQLWTAEKTVHS